MNIIVRYKKFFFLFFFILSVFSNLNAQTLNIYASPDGNVSTNTTEISVCYGATNILGASNDQLFQISRYQYQIFNNVTNQFEALLSQGNNIWQPYLGSIPTQPTFTTDSKIYRLAYKNYAGEIFYSNTINVIVLKYAIAADPILPIYTYCQNAIPVDIPTDYSQAIGNISWQYANNSDFINATVISGATNVQKLESQYISTASLGSFYYRQVAQANGCTNYGLSVNVIVQQIDASLSVGSSNQTVCINTPIVSTTYTTTATSSVTSSGLPSGITATWSNTNKTLTLSGTPTQSGTYTYTLTFTGSCGSITRSGVITVTPNNTISLTSGAGTDAQSACINLPITNITYSTTGATGGTVTGLPNGVTGIWANNGFTISGTPTQSGTYSYTITLTGGCGNITKSGTIVVNPTNTISLTSAAGTNNQDVCINTAITNITYATTGATGVATSGLPTGLTAGWAGNVVTISGTPTQAGSYSFTITLTGGCGTVTETVLLNVRPANTISLSSGVGSDGQTVCINTAITSITYSTTGATNATVVGLPAGVTGIWANNIFTISGTPTASGTFNYTITLTGGCGNITKSGTIIVNPVNTISLISAAGTNNQDVCINASLTQIRYATTGATGASFSGLPPGVSGSWASNVVTISGTPTQAGSYSFTITLTGGCGTVTETVLLNVRPANTISLTSGVGSDGQTVCINTAITSITYSTTGATNATVVGLPAGVTGGWANNGFTISGTPTVSGTFNYTITLTGGCGNVTISGTINVTPNNTITLTSGVGTDAQTACINTAITSITYSTTGATNATVVGLPAGVTGGWANNGFTISGTPTASGTFNYTITLTGGCGNITKSGTIIVNPVNTISLISAAGTNNQDVCINASLTQIRYATTGATGASFSGLPPGVSGSWASNVVTISGTPTQAGSYSFTITLTGGCGTVTETVLLNVRPANTISLSSGVGSDGQTVCINTAINSITYSTTGATNATVVGLPAGVTGIWANNIFTISGTPTVSGTFNYTITLTGGCGIVTKTGTINVNTANTIGLTSALGTDAQTVCISTAITSITYSTTGATGASFSGLPPGVSGLWSNNVVTISGIPTQAGTYNYTITLTGGCGNITKSGTISVSPINTISLTSAAGTDAQTVCINIAITSITYSTTGATNATVVGLPAGVTGGWANNGFTISGTPTVSGTFNYTITLTGGCGIVTESGTLIVTPNNTITRTSGAGTDAQSACINLPITNITYSTTGATGGTVTGLPNGVTGIWANNGFTISGTPTQSGTYSYTITLTGGCGNITKSGTIVVNPTNTISLTSAAGTNNQDVCINTAITNITYATTGATGVATSGLPTGLTAGWAGNVVTISGTPTQAGSYSFTITLTGGCGTVTETVLLNVRPANTISLSSGVGSDGQTVCINTAITSITYSTTGATNATVVGLPAGVTGIWANNIFTISGTPTASGTFNYTITLTGGCGNITKSGTIIVNPVNTISLISAAGTNNQDVCINASLTQIRYATTGATGASFSGLPPGVSGSWASNVVTISGTPTQAGSYSFTITLTGGCGTVTETVLLNVRPANTISLTSGVGSDGQTVCINTAITSITYSTTGATNATVVGLPAGVTGGWANNGFTISGTPTVSGTFNYTITLTGGCGNVTISGTINVTPNNTITLTSGVGTDAQTACINTAITSITYSTTGATNATVVGLPAGVTGGWANNGFTISGTPTASGTFNYTITLTGGCGNITKSGTIIVNPVNTISLISAAGTNNQDVCINASLTQIRYATTGATGASFSGLPPGVSGSWASNVVTISGTPTQAGSYSFTITLTGGCGTVTETVLLNVRPANTISLSSGVGSDGQTVCINTAINSITYSTTGATNATVVGLPAGVTGIWANNIFTISGTPTVSGTFNYTITLTGGCGIVTKTGTINVNTANTIGLTSALGTDAQTVCISTAITSITYSTTGATGASFSGLPPGVSGLWSNNVVTISGIPTQAGTYNYTITLTGGCGNITKSGTISVSPINTISLTSAAGTDAQTVCINIAITSITYSTTGATNATVVGLPAGVTGGWANNGFTISGTPTVSGTFNYTITLTGGCGIVTESGTLIVTPNNTITRTSGAGTDAQSACINLPITNITYSTTGATGGTVTGLPNGVTGIWANNGFTISGTPTQSGTYSYTITLTGGCGNITKSGTIVVNPTNTISLTSAAGTNNQTVEINLPITNITYSTTGANGAIFSGLPNGVSGSWAGNVVTISGTPTQAGNFTYTVTLTGGCGTITTTGNISVRNTIVLVSPTGTDAQSVCLNSPLTEIKYLTTGATNATVANLPSGLTAIWSDIGNSQGYLTINGTPTQSGSFTYTISLVGGFGTIGKTGFINVSSGNTIALSSTNGTNAQTLCIGNAINSITYTTTGATGAIFDYLPSGVTGSWANNVITITGTPAVSGSFNYRITLTGGCGTVLEFGVININPANTITLTSGAGTDAQTVCLNTAINSITYSTTGATNATVVGLPAGVTGIWANNGFTISGTPTVSGTFNYTITLTGGCGNITKSGIIIVSNLNTITLSSGSGSDIQTKCINTPLTEITYLTSGATGAIVTGLPTGVTGVWLNNGFRIFGTPTQSGTFNYTITLTGGCGVVTTNGVIIVTPNNTIDLSSAPGTDSQDVCINGTLTNITYSTNGATGANFSGLPPGVSGSWANNVVTISGTPALAGTYSYTITLTGGCGIITKTGIINVKLNSINLISAAGTDAQTSCINAPLTQIKYKTSIATGATVAGLPNGLSGVWTTTTTNNITDSIFTITGIPTQAGTFNYTITLTGGCGTVTKNGTIAITSANTIGRSSNPGTESQTVCINAPITDITYSTAGATGAIVNGLPNGVSYLWNNNALRIFGTPSESGRFDFTITLTGGCGIITETGFIIVTPSNTITRTSIAGSDAQSVCINEAIANITYTSSGATGASFSGLPAGVSGSWSNNGIIISGTPTVSGTYSYTITLTGGCGVVTKTGTINVRINTIALTSSVGTDSQTACINLPITNITYSTTGATNATVTGLPNGVTGVWANNTFTISGTATQTGTFSYTINLTGGCGTVTKTGIVVVSPSNTITRTSSAGTDAQTICINTSLTQIKYKTTGALGAFATGLPNGVTGVWTTTTTNNITDSVFTISGTPTQSGTFTYTITLTGGCSTVTTTGRIDVKSDNTISLNSAAGTDSQTVCINTVLTIIRYKTTGATNASVTGLPNGLVGVWNTTTINNITDSVFTISGTPTIAGTFTYTITTQGGCNTATANGIITVTPANTISLTSSVGTDAQTACINLPISDITYATTGATGAIVNGLPNGVIYLWNNNALRIFGTPTQTGTFTYTITLTGGCGTITKTGVVVVSPSNTISRTSSIGTDSQTVCINAPLTEIKYKTTGATGAVATGLPNGMVGVWTTTTFNNITDSVFTISGTPTVSGTYSYTITLTGGCGVVTKTGTINVRINTITLSSSAGTDSQTACINLPITNITYSTTGATNATVTGLPNGVTGVWANNTFTISGTATQTGTFSYTINLTGGCGTVTKTGIVVVSPSNTITRTSSAGTDAQTICINTSLTQIKYKTTGALGAFATGLPNGVTGVWTTTTTNNITDSVFTISGTPTQSGTFTYTITLTGGCYTVTTTGTIDVKPDNTISLNSAAGTDSQTVCINAPLTEIKYKTTGATGGIVTGLPNGLVGVWTTTTTNNITDSVFVISGTPTVAGTFSYTVTTLGGCVTNTAFVTGTIDVKPLNRIQLTSAAGTISQTLCFGNSIQSITYTTTGALGAVVTGLPNGLVGVWTTTTTNNITDSVFTISGTPTQAGTFSYTISLIGGCGTITSTGVIDVKINVINLSSSAGTDAQTICINTPLTQIKYKTILATGAFATGLPNGVVGVWTTTTTNNITDSVFTISGTPTQSGTFTYTITLTGGCYTVTTTGTIDVKPDNTISLNSAAGTDSQTVCINAPLTEIKYKTTGATGGIVTGLPNGLVGVWTTTTTNNITDSVFVISGTPTVAGTFSYTVTTLGGCVTNTAFVTGTIDVKPLNRIQLTSAAGTISQTLCFGNSIQSITYTTTGALGAVVTGLPNGLVGVWTTTTTNNITDSVFTISGTPTQAGTFSYTISLIGGCGTITSTGVIDVKINVINLSSSAGTDAQTICINTPLTQIKYKTILATGAFATGLPNGVVGVWTTTTTNNITDSVFTISGTPTQSGTFTYTITLTGGCYTVTTTGTIDVKPDNTISLNSAAGTDSQTVCINAPLTEIKYKTTGATGGIVTGLPNGLVGVWTTTTTNNITDSVFVISGTPTVAGTFSYTVTTLGGCVTNTAFVTGIIDVKPNNKISLFIGSDGQGVCINTAIQSLTYTTTGATGAIVTGLPNGVTGVWTTTTNNNIQDSIYFISGTPTESGIFNYTITLTGGCAIIRQNGTLFVKENKIILNSSAGTDNQTNCINSPITNIVYRTEVATSATVFGLPNGVTAVWVDSVLTISGISTQSGTFTYTINTVGGCSSKTAMGVITIKPNNTITQVSAPETNNQTLCINTSINDIRYQSTGATGVEVIGLPTGINGVWEDSLITIKGSPTQAGTFPYTINLTGGCGTITSTGIIEVKINSINLLTNIETEKQIVCINTSINEIKYKTSIATGAYVTGLPKGVYGNWSIVAYQGVVDSVFVINGTPIESGTYTYTITLTGGCSNIERVGVLNISPESNPGNIGFEKGASPICSLGTTPTISLFNYVGETINWEEASSKDSIFRDMGEVGYQLINNINNVSEELSSVITLYRAKIKSGACPAKYSPSVSVEVLPLPKVISSIPDTICGPGVLNLTAKSNLGTINWYSGSISEQILFTGDNFITPIVDSNSTFYASGIFNGCSSTERLAITSVVKYVPQIIKIVNNEICGPGKLNLIAKASKGVVNWYENNIGGNKLVTDTLFSTPQIDSTKIYYAEAQYDGCVSQQRVSVFAVINQLPIVKALPSPTFTCVGKGIYVDKYVSGGTPGYEFIINADNKNVLGTNYGKINGKLGGISQVSYQVKDQKGCLSKLSSEFTVVVDTPISPKVFFYEAYYDENLIIKTKTDSTYTKYLWEPQVKLNFYDNKNPTFKGISDQTYYLLRTDTLTQCDVTDTYNITVTKDHILLLPNAFTPNGDGLNDEIKIINNAGIGEFHYLKIFNRFGKIVFQTTNISEGWNGKVGDQLQQMDAYFYTAEYVTKENLVVIKNGTFILLN